MKGLVVFKRLNLPILPRVERASYGPDPDPITAQEGSFDPLHFQPRLVHSFLGNLVVPSPKKF